MRRILLWTGMTALMILTACSSSNENANEQVKVPVEVMEAEKGRLPQSLTFNGDIIAETEVKVFSKVPDRIDAFYVDEGDEVKAGQPLAHVLATAIEQGVRQAEAALSAARAQDANMRVEYERTRRLYEQNAMSQQQFDAVKTQYEAAVAQTEQAEAALTTARSQLTDATLSAPIRGIIGKRYYETGDMASPAMPVFSIVQMDRVKMQVQAAERDLGSLAERQPAKVRVRSYTDTTFDGEVLKISPVLDPMTRMADVEILIPNPGHLLKPGMYAQVEIITGCIENTIVIPRHAVLESTSLESNDGKDTVVKNYFVYVIADSMKAEQRLLEVDYVNHQYIAVKSGIEVGEKIVITGQNNLRDGLPVLIAETEEVR